MNSVSKFILTAIVTTALFSGVLTAEEISFSVLSAQNEYSKILKKQQKEERKDERKQRKYERKLRRYNPFDQTLGHGAMTDFRSGFGLCVVLTNNNDEISTVVEENQGSINALQFDLGLGPGFFIYGHAYEITGPFQLFLLDHNASRFAMSYGGGIGFNKRIMLGLYPDNIYLLGGVNYMPYDWYVNGKNISGETYFYHTSIGYDMQLSKRWAINIADNFEYVPDCEGYTYYLNTVSFGLALTFPY